MISSASDNRQFASTIFQMKMTGAVRKQLDTFLEGFYEIIPRKLIAIFNEQELELLISGLPEIDIDDVGFLSEARSCAIGNMSKIFSSTTTQNIANTNARRRKSNGSSRRFARLKKKISQSFCNS